MDAFGTVFRRLVYLLVARRFVAGEDMEDALRRVHSLNDRGFRTTVNILGESVASHKEAEGFTEEYRKLAARIGAAGTDTRIAVKLTQLGLLFDEDECFANLMVILRVAHFSATMVEIDREAPETHKVTRRLIRRIPYFFRSIVRVCVQLNYGHANEEIRTLLADGFSVRVCKGAYAGGVSATGMLRDRMLRVAREFRSRPAAPSGAPASIAYATHDLLLLEQIPSVYIHHDDFELQLLSGIEQGAALKLRKRGYRVCLYVPYGPTWWPYGKRRLMSILRIYGRNMKYRLLHK